jgi:protein SCO1/2
LKGIYGMIAEPPLYRDTPEETIAELVDSIKESPERRDLLARLLPERTSLYEGRSANETTRIRGYVLAAFEQVGLPDAALPYVLEELESGREAYLVAGAAKALRGLHNPSSQVVPFLLKAVENIKYIDDAVTFEQYKPRWPITNYTTALSEIFETLGWLGFHAESALPQLVTLCAESRDDFSKDTQAGIEKAIDLIRSAGSSHSTHGHSCCDDVSEAVPMNLGVPITFHAPRQAHRNPGSMAGIELEDQDGNTLTYSAFFSGKPSIVVFFYTRCNNPNKCSLTITKLARLQKAVIEERLGGLLKIAAITYDPEYDLPARLKAYGENRGVSFSEDNRILRTRSGFHELQGYFQLGVNYSAATVNRHSIELFILDSQGKIASTFSRLQWDVQEVLDQAKTLLRPA